MTTAEEILDRFLRDLHWPYNSKANAIKAMKAYAELKLSEHSTKEQEVVGYLCTVPNQEGTVFIDTVKDPESLIKMGYTITPLVKK